MFNKKQQFSRYITTPLFCFAMFFSGCKEKSEKAPDHSKAKEHVLTVATTGDTPAYSYIEEGQLKGFEIELMEEIAKELKKPVKFETVKFKKILETVESGKADIAIGTISSEEKKSHPNLLFSDSYHSAVTVVLTFKNSTVQTVDGFIKKIKGAFGVEKKSIQQHLLKDKLHDTVFLGKKFEFTPKLQDLVNALDNKNLEAIVVNEIYAKHLIQQEKNYAYFLIPNGESHYVIVTKKGNENMMHKINKILGHLETSGKISEIEARYFKP